MLPSLSVGRRSRNNEFHAGAGIAPSSAAINSKINKTLMLFRAINGIKIIKIQVNLDTVADSTVINLRLGNLVTRNKPGNCIS